MPIKIQEANTPKRRQLISDPHNPLNKRVEKMLLASLTSVMWRPRSEIEVNTWQENEPPPCINDALTARVGEGGKVVCYRILSGPTVLCPQAFLELELHSLCKLDNGIFIPLYEWA